MTVPIKKTRDLSLVYAISFMDLFAIGLTYPLLSTHLRDLGASHFVVGLISSLYSGLQVISGPVVGSWSDVRDRKSVLISTLILCCVGYMVLGLTSSVVVIGLIRIVLGVTKHTQSLCKAIITDLLPPDERASAFGRSAAYSQLGFIVGPVLGGHLAELSHGFLYVCSVTGLLFVANIGLACALTNSKRPSGKNRKVMGEFGKSITDLADVNWGALWDTFLLRFIFGFSVTMFFSQQAIYLREQFGLSQRHIGYTISYFSATGTGAAFLLSHITNYFYKEDATCLKRLAHFFLLMSLSSVCLYLAPNIQIFLLVLVPFSLSCTVLRIVSMELMLKRAADDHRGSLSGASNSIMSVARFVTPVSSGLIADTLGGPTGMLFSSIPPLIGTAITWRMKKLLAKDKTL